MALQLPIGEEAEFQGVIDLLGGVAMVYPDGGRRGGSGDAPRVEPIPADYEEEYEIYRQRMIEKIVETDESLLIRYLEGEDIDADDLRRALRRATIERSLVPVLCGSATTSKGVHPSMSSPSRYRIKSDSSVSTIFSIIRWR